MWYSQLPICIGNGYSQSYQKCQHWVEPHLYTFWHRLPDSQNATSDVNGFLGDYSTNHLAGRNLAPVRNGETSSRRWTLGKKKHFTQHIPTHSIITLVATRVLCCTADGPFTMTFESCSPVTWDFTTEATFSPVFLKIQDKDKPKGGLQHAQCTCLKALTTPPLPRPAWQKKKKSSLYLAFSASFV